MQDPRMAAQDAIVVSVLLYIVLPALATTEVVYTSPTSCPVRPCLTLEDYARNASEYFSSDTSFIFQEGEHYLNAVLVLDDVRNISMGGVGAKIIASENAGIAYHNSQEIVLNSLAIAHRSHTAIASSVFFFSNSNSIRIIDVHFTGSPAGEVDYSRALTFNHSSAHIAYCSFSHGHGEYGGAIEMDSSDVIFSSTNFTNNTADILGGAIFATNNCTLAFWSTNIFLKNKAGLVPSSTERGGGVIYASQSSLEFKGLVNFMENGYYDATDEIVYGGAIRMDHSTLSIQNRAIFSNNIAYYGGSIYSEDSELFLNGTMTFSNSAFGGTLSIHRSNFSCIGEATFRYNAITGGGYGSVIYSDNCNLFFSGEIHFTDNKAASGVGGTIFALKSGISFEGNVTFANNIAGLGGAIHLDTSALECRGIFSITNNTSYSTGGGLYAIDSTVTVTGRSTYSENLAIGGGGAMGLEGTSILVLQSPVILNFYRNTAIDSGGAILFVDSNAMYIVQCQNTTVERQSCFFQVEAATYPSDFDVHLNFTENKANTGTVLYGGSLQLCRVQVNEQLSYTSGFDFLQNISTFNLGDEGNSSYISSNSLRVCFCDDNMVPNCSQQYVSLRTRRGQLFNISVITVGQINMPVPSEVRAYANISDGLTELTPQGHAIDAACTDIGFRLLAKEDYKLLALFPNGPCGTAANTLRFVLITLDQCPHGFDLVVKSCKCEKRLLELNSENNCDIETALIERPGNAWVKPVLDENQTYHGFILHRDCPLGYCKPPEVTVMLDFSSNSTDSQCRNRRSGILCGACERNHSLVLSSLHCKICENKHISLLLFFAFSGIILIFILLALHMTVATGTINGLILYVNIVNANRFIFFTSGRTNVLTVFIAWLNLDFGIPSCFYDGLDSYSYAWLEYIFPLYLWFLIGVIVFSNRVSTKVGKLFGSNPIAVLATVILLSYTKLLQAAILALSSTYLEYPEGDLVRVWRFDANITYMKGKHIVLAVVALGVISFLVLPYIFLLLFGYRLQAYSGKRAFAWFNRFKPLLDAYYAPYHKDTRYWSGFTLLVRGALYCSFSALTNDTAHLVAISSVFTALAVVPWVSYRLYEKRYLDILEASFIVNICILSTVTQYLKSVDASLQSQEIITSVFVGVAFVEFLGITVFHVYLRTKDTKIVHVFESGKIIEYGKEIVKRLSPKKSTGEEEQSKTITLPTKSFVELRESLLEDEFNE